MLRPLKVQLGTQNRIPASSPDQSGISRRQLIQFLALGCAGLVSADTLAGVVGVAREPGGPVRQGQVLSEAQMRLLRELVEVIIPQTDTPGAAATDTHGFIDDQLTHCGSRDEAGQFIGELDRLAEVVRQHWRTNFADLSAVDKHAAMNSISRNESPFEQFPDDFFSRLKALTVLGYYSSEAGASEELVFLPVPGGYRSDFKVSENDGRAFSPHVF